MSATRWTSDRTETRQRVTLAQLDDSIDRLPLSEIERSAIWLFAFAARENASRVGAMAAAA